MKLTRRYLLVGAASLLASGANADEPILTDDGLYKQLWFLESFLELSDDLEGAAKEGKRFVINWELKGCPYCKETHFFNFVQPRISDYVKANFEVLQLNVIGSRKVTDFDGTGLSEKDLAAKYGVRFTPTFQFFGERAGPLKALPPARREVARAPGYLRPDDFLAMFRYVREKSLRARDLPGFRQIAAKLNRFEPAACRRYGRNQQISGRNLHAPTIPSRDACTWCW
jgi:thioredoxin-related protein